MALAERALSPHAAPSAAPRGQKAPQTPTPLSPRPTAATPHRNAGRLVVRRGHSAGRTVDDEDATARSSPGCARARLRCWSRSERGASDATAQPSIRSRRRPVRARAVSRRGIPPRAGSVGRMAANRRAARLVVRPPRSLSLAVPATSTRCLRPVLTRFSAARFS